MNPVRRFDPADLLGEGVRVLKRLVPPGSRLEKRDGFYALTGTGRAGRAMHVPLAIVDAFRRRDWLSDAPGGEGLRLSDVGLGWLRRTLAGEDPFAEQHGERVRTEATAEDGSIRSVVVNDGESPLARLRAAKAGGGKPCIDETQFLAGERLRRDFTLANLMPRMTVDLTAPVVAGGRGTGTSDLSDIALAARQRFSRALTALGNDLANVAVDVCCHLKELGTADSTTGWPESAALVVLKLALDRLAHHYGFTLRGAPSRTRAWRAPEDGEGEGEKTTAGKK